MVENVRLNRTVTLGSAQSLQGNQEKLSGWMDQHFTWAVTLSVSWALGPYTTSFISWCGCFLRWAALASHPLRVTCWNQSLRLDGVQRWSPEDVRRSWERNPLMALSALRSRDRRGLASPAPCALLRVELQGDCCLCIRESTFPEDPAALPPDLRLLTSRTVRCRSLSCKTQSWRCFWYSTRDWLWYFLSSTDSRTPSWQSTTGKPSPAVMPGTRAGMRNAWNRGLQCQSNCFEVLRDSVTELWSTNDICHDTERPGLPVSSEIVKKKVRERLRGRFDKGPWQRLQVA